ncbi:MAG: FG-GAP-like repeat-containing protein [Bacteroidia bacterium]
MRKIIPLLTIFLSLSVIAQKRLLTYSPSYVPVFLNQSGDTLSKALIGGLNQPQFQALDINNDGKKDLIVHDRTGGFFMPFINTGNNDITTYKYSPNFVSSFPIIQKGWVLFVDYDNDGKEDLWASIDFKAVLFKNVTKTGDKSVKFQKVGPYLKAYKYNGGLDTVNFASSFNNIPAIGDVDGDGDVDFFSYEAGVGQMLLYRNMCIDFKLPLHPPVFDFADFCWGNFRDTSFDGVKVFACPFKYYRKKHSGGSALLWLDNDNDGDMDLLMGNADGKNIIFLKNGKKDFNLTQDSIISYDGHWPKNSTPVQLSSFPASFMLDADGDGVKDIIVAPNQAEQTSKIEQSKQVQFYKNKGTNSLPDFQLQKKNYFTDKFLDHGGYTAPVLKDIDSDQDLDLIIATNADHAKTGNKTYHLVLYRNIGSKTKPVFKLEDEDLWKISKDSLQLLAVTFGDINGDGLPDIIAGDYSGGISYYKNTGSSTSWGFTTITRNYLNLNVGQNNSPQLIDMDKDGKLDLVIGERDGNFNYYRNTGTPFSPQFTLVDDTLGNFLANELVWQRINFRDTLVYYYEGYAAGEISDLDNDAKYDMVFGGLEGRVRVMKFNDIGQKQFNEDTTVLFDSSYMRYNKTDYGNFTRPATGDLDGDGVKDIIVGNDRGGIHFLKGKVEILDAVQIRKRNEPLVYPNPTNGSLLNISKRNAEEFTFSLYDLSGKLILSEISGAGHINHIIQLGDLSNGLYFLQSFSKNGDTYYSRVFVSK